LGQRPPGTSLVRVAGRRRTVPWCCSSMRAALRLRVI
jgi:hypothetical protein